MSVTDTQDSTQPASQPVAQPDAGQSIAAPIGAQPGAPQAAPEQQSAPGMAALAPAKPVPPTPPPPTAAQTQAVTLATKSPNPVAQHIHDIAETLTGGGRYTTTYDDKGNPARHKVPVPTAHLGLALALEVLRGGLAGTSGSPVDAAARGMAQGDKDQAERQAAQQRQNQQDSADQARKLSITEANLRLHQTALNVGKQDEESNKHLDAAFAPVMDDLERNHPEAILAKVPEWGLNDALKKYNVTKEMAIPYDTVPVLDQKTGEQAKHSDGTPVWGHMYAIVDPSIKTTLSDETQTMGYNVGEFKDADGNKAQIGNPGNWPLKDIIARHTKYAQISTAESLLNRQIAELKGMDTGKKEGPQLNLADQVRQDPSMLSAVEDYSKYAGVGDLDQVIYTMGQSKDPAERQSAAKIMQLAGVTPAELEDKHNDRVQAAAEAAKPKVATPETPEKAALTQAQIDEAKAAADQKKAEAQKIWNDIKTQNAGADTTHDRFDDHGTNVGFLETLPVGLQQTVKAIGEGRQGVSAYMLGRKEGLDIMKAVNRVYPDYDYSKAQTYEKSRQSFMGQGKNAQSINALNTALAHVGRMYDNTAAISTVPGVKSIAQMAGNTHATAVNSEKAAVASELAKAYASGAFTQGEKDEWEDKLNVSSPYELKGNLIEFTRLLKGKLDSLEQTWENGTPSAFVTPIQILNPHAQAVYEKLTGEKADPYTRQPNAGVTVQDVKRQQRPGEVPVMGADGSTVIGFTMPGKTGYRPVKPPQQQ